MGGCWKEHKFKFLDSDSPVSVVAFFKYPQSGRKVLVRKGAKIGFGMTVVVLRLL